MSEKFKKIKQKVGITSEGSVPSNQDLYKKIKEEAKAKFDRYPSAYASSWIVREYKSRGGKYS